MGVFRHRTWPPSSRRLVALCAIVGTLAGGCAARRPPSQFIQVGAHPNDLPPVAKVLVVGDVVLVRNAALTDDYVILDASLSSARLMRDRAAAELRNKGYLTDASIGPLVAFYKAPELTFPTRQSENPPTLVQPVPLACPTEIETDTEFRDALKILLSHIVLTVEKQGVNHEKMFAADEVAQKALRTVASRQHADALLLTAGHGRLVSGGKQLAEGLATGLITSAMTLGMVTVTSHHVTWLDTYVALVDLRNGGMLWSNSLRLTQGDPRNEEYYKNWAWNLLSELPSATPPEMQAR